ncbi:tape measure protein [Fibrobacter sp.]|uniref:tape measure protein n=1 Tax=Fibrobacter sp. TaxID=35828 RepID=UPI00388F23CC
MAQTKEVFNLEYRFGGNAEFLTRLEQSISKLDKSFTATQVDSSKLGDAMEKNMAKASRSMDNAGQSAKRLENSVSGIGSKLKMLAGAFIGFETVKTGISAFAEREKLQTDIGTLLGDDAAGKQFSDYITQFAKATPYGISELSGLAKGLIQYNVSLEDTKMYMQQLGDIAMGDKQKMASLGVVLGQVASAGRLQGQDLMQFINAGFNPLTVLSEMTGKTMAQLRDDMSQGAISFEMVSAALKKATSEGGRFYKGMEKGSKTLSGLWSTAMDNIKQSLADAFEKNQDKLKDFARRIGELDLSKLVDGLANVAGAVLRIGEVLAPLVEKMTQIPGLVEAIMMALAVEKFSAVTGGVNMLSGGFGKLVHSLQRTNRELLTMGRNGKKAAMGLAAVAGGGVAGFMGGAETSGGVVAGGLSTGAAVFASTGNPLLALLATGGSFGGSLVNAGYQALNADAEAKRNNAANQERWNSNAALMKAYKTFDKDKSEKNARVLEDTYNAYARKYGEDAAEEYLSGISGLKSVSEDAKANVTNFNTTNNNTVTQNNSISSEFSELGNLIKQNLVELMERNLKFDTSMAMEVAGA